MRIRATIISFALVIAAAVTTAAAPATAAGDLDRGVTVRLVTHDSFAISKKVVREFTRRTGVEVEVLPAGDAGAALNQVILTKDDPIGDVFFGVDNTFLTRALDEQIFETVTVRGAGRLPLTLQLDPLGRAYAIDHGAVCVNHDKKWFARHDVPVPRTLGDLAEAPIPRPAGRREPGDVVPGPRVPARDDRPVRRRGMARLLDAAP